MAGQAVTCPNCNRPIKVAAVVEVMARPVAQQAEVKTNVKQGALIGGYVCLGLGVIIAVMSRWMFVFYGPLFFVAFVLSIVAMAQRRVAGGVFLLLLTIIGPPVLLIGLSLGGEVNDLVQRAHQVTRVAQAQPTGGDTNVQSEAAEATKVVSLPAPTQAEAEPAPSRLGDSIVIDDIKITFKGARLGSVSREDRHGREAHEYEGTYLIVDLTMKNTTPGKIIHLQEVWTQSKATDNFDNILQPQFDHRYAVELIVGHVRSQDLKPGETVKDTMIFAAPIAAATTFTVTASPGFWKNGEGNRINRLSNTSLTLAFKREDIKHL
jgi:hypothetical protein